jgi:hypothetical protein
MDSKGKSKQPAPQPVELPTDTYILSLNKKYAQVETNQNNELIYSLKNPIKLNKGDQVSLYKSYLNIRGLNSNTITIDKDYDVDIKTGLFIPASLKKSASTGNEFLDYQNWQEYYQVPDPNGIQIDNNGGFSLDRTRISNLLEKYSFALDGDFNSPYIGVQVQELQTLQQPIYTPVSVTANFKVAAGQYDVNALALEITSQLNGSQLTGAENQNIVFDGSSSDRSYDAIFSRGGTFTKQFEIDTAGYTELNPFPASIESAGFNEYLSQKPVMGSYALTGDKHIAFLDLKRADEIMQEIINYIAGDRSKSAFDILKVDNAVNYTDLNSRDNLSKADNLLYPKPIGSKSSQILGVTNVNPGISIKDIKFKIPDAAGNYEVTPNNPDPGGQVGALDIGWYTIPCTRTGGGNPDTQVNCTGWPLVTQEYWYGVISEHAFEPSQVPVADQAIMAQVRNETFRTYGTKSFSLVFNNENRFAFNNLSEVYRIPSVTSEVGGESTPGSAVGNQASKFNPGQSKSYPQECSSGNFVSSFDNKLKQQTAKYKELEAEQAKYNNKQAEYWLYEWALELLPHDYFYDSEVDGQLDWDNNSIWSRLGFSYSDLGNITPQLEKFNTPNGGTTQSTMLGFITHNSYSSALQIGMSGLGDSYSKDNKGSTNIETFDEVGLMSEGTEGSILGNTFKLETLIDYFNQYDAFKAARLSSEVFILATSQFFNASSLPDLSGGRNYFILESDIIPSNYLDESNSQRAIIGFVDKEFSSNDTIFSSTAIPFSLKQSKILNTIKMSVLNADGTKPNDAVLGDSSSFILMIQRNSNAILNYLEDEEIDLIADESTRPTTQPITE